jgi:hypothetical protein
MSVVGTVAARAGPNPAAGSGAKLSRLAGFNNGNTESTGVMKRIMQVVLHMAAAILPVTGWLAGPIAVNAAPEDQPAALNLAPGNNPQFTPPAREVLKLIQSGVPDSVTLAYIANSTFNFNLSADNLINLQQMGISQTVSAAMLNRDKELGGNPGAAQPLQNPSDTNAPGTADLTATADQSGALENQSVSGGLPANVYTYLMSYGSWYDLPDCGWCWQPKPSLAPAAYPWGLAVLQYGSWIHDPSRGWFWIPGSDVRDDRGSFTGLGGVIGGDDTETVADNNVIVLPYSGRFGGAHAGYTVYASGVGIVSGVSPSGSRSQGHAEFRGTGSHGGEHDGHGNHGGDHGGGAHSGGGGHGDGGHGGGVSGGHGAGGH